MAADPSKHPPHPPGYWYEGQTEVRALLTAVRRFRDVEQSMRRGMASDMDMNVSDMEALQLVIEGDRRQEPVTPSRLSEHLGISTASTTKLIDRLTSANFLERRAHPTDRRSVWLAPTAHAHAEVRARLSRMHREMAGAALAVPPEARAAVIGFLDALTQIYAAEATRSAPTAP